MIRHLALMVLLSTFNLGLTGASVAAEGLSSVKEIQLNFPRMKRVLDIVSVPLGRHDMPLRSTLVFDSDARLVYAVGSRQTWAQSASQVLEQIKTATPAADFGLQALVDTLPEAALDAEGFGYTMLEVNFQVHSCPICERQAEVMETVAGGLHGLRRVKIGLDPEQAPVGAPLGPGDSIVK